MTAVETFDAYRPDGTPLTVVVRHHWEAARPSLREDHERLLIRNGIILSPHSCAVAVIMAAINQGREA